MILSFLLPNSTASNILLNIIRQKNESTTSINNIVQYQSTFPTYSSNTVVQSLITKPNSYLYNPDEDDDEVLLNRVKRDPAPFVCKGKILQFYYFI